MRREGIGMLFGSQRERRGGERELGFPIASCVASLAILTWIFLGPHIAHAATFQIADPVEFNKIIYTNAVLTTNATINTWLEGPVWVPSGGGYLVFCDQNNNRLKKLVPPAAITDF